MHITKMMTIISYYSNISQLLTWYFSCKLVSAICARAKSLSNCSAHTFRSLSINLSSFYEFIQPHTHKKKSITAYQQRCQIQPRIEHLSSHSRLLTVVKINRNLGAKFSQHLSSYSLIEKHIVSMKDELSIQT